YLGDLGTSHLVARQELRALIAGLNLPTPRRLAAGAQEAAQAGAQPAGAGV
ncbi:MAG TPA: division plane positioning ATPase MipZ, partial [Novosphingobium sp.]|nr:division plane positioning ATPase MipZ [Novosphingobium sp.]